MNNNNYIQEIETVQQTQKYYSYIYEIKHLPTGKLYVGSRCNQILKSKEDCLNDTKYLGSSCREEGPFSQTDTKTNPQDYKKTVLKIFYRQNPSAAWKAENGKYGLIARYLKKYGKDICLNGCYQTYDGNNVFNTAGQNPFLNKTEEEMIEISFKMSEGQKIYWQNKTEDELLELSLKRSEAAKIQWQNKTEEEKEEIGHKIGETCKLTWENKSEEEKENHGHKISETYHNKSDEEKAELSRKNSEARLGEKNPMYGKNAYANKTEKEMIELRYRLSEGKKIANNIKYISPYNNEYINTSSGMSRYISKNYPNEKQWMEYTKSEREQFKIN